MEAIVTYDFQNEPTAEEQERLEQEHRLLFAAQTALESLESLQKRITASRTIDRSTANTARTLTTGLEAMDAHFANHPVNSYTQLPSSTNLKPTLEGLVKSIGQTVARVIKAILRFITTVVRAITGRRQRNNAAVEEIQVSLSKDLAEFTKKRPTPQPNMPAKVSYAVNGLTPMALWFGGRQNDFLPKYTPHLFVQALYATEASFLKFANEYCSGLNEALKDESRIRRGSIRDLAEIAPPEPMGIFADHVTRVLGGVGHALEDNFAKTLSTVTSAGNHRPNLPETHAEAIEYAAALSTSPAVTHNLRFANSRLYSQLERLTAIVEKRINTILDDRRKTLEQVAVDALLFVVNDVKSVASAMGHMETLINQYRIAVGKTGTLMRVLRDS